METRKIGIIMNGVTGRMGTNQHLIRSVMEIIRQGGVRSRSGKMILPDPILIGRNADKLQALAELTGLQQISTDLESVFEDDRYTVYFDAQTTGRRAEAVMKAAKAGKHVYCEKPSAADSDEALEMVRVCEASGVKHGVVQDKLWLPGLIKLKRLIDQGFFGRIHTIKGDFGYWVFEGHSIPAQRPSWNYKREEDGGIILDMLCHWQYILEHLFGRIRAVSCLGAIHIPERVDEKGKPYNTTAEDAAYSTFELEEGMVAHFNSSWCTRVRRDDLLTIQVDGSEGSAVAGLRNCWIQHYHTTPKPVWNPDIDQPIDFFENWARVPEQETYDNAFKAQWELFLQHVVDDEPFPWNLQSGARGVQVAEAGYRSWKEKRWINIPEK